MRRLILTRAFLIVLIFAFHTNGMAQKLKSEEIQIEIDIKQAQANDLSSELRNLKIALAKQKRTERADDKKKKDSKKKIEDDKKESDKRILEEKRRKRKIEIRSSKEYIRDSLENYINENILHEESPFKAKISISANCAVELKSKDQDYHFNLKSVNILKKDKYKAYSKFWDFKFQKKVDYYTIGIDCSKDGQKCLKRGGKFIDNTDSTIPFSSEIVVDSLMSSLTKMKYYCN